MKNILLGMVALISVGCANMTALSANKTNKVRARITYYNAHEDKWGSRIASGNGRAKEGVTVAAHPIFDFGTQISIPALKGVVGSGKFIVQDRGSAVTKKRASHGGAFVFDVYLNKTRRATNKFASALPAYMDVLISNTVKLFDPNKVQHRKLARKKRK